MAYSSDFIVDIDNTMSRDSEWFRVNQSRSATPICQHRPTDRALLTYPNEPLRTVHVPGLVERMVLELAQATRERLLAAYRPPTTPPHLLPRPEAPVARTAMHGGAGPGERFQPRKPRVAPIKTNPVPAEPTRVRFERVTAPKAFVPSRISAVAALAVVRGRREAAELATLRLNLV